MPNLDKIIYLDSDTICLKDLSKLYNINPLDKMFMGKIITYNRKTHDFISDTGVLLLNLRKMRELQVERKVITLLNSGYRHPIFHDQAIINIYFKKFIGVISPEYNAYPFSFRNVKQYKKESGGLYDLDSIYLSLKFHSIIHNQVKLNLI